MKKLIILGLVVAGCVYIHAQKKQIEDEKLDEALEETFPASDAVAKYL